jgi:hypothetical protein
VRRSTACFGFSWPMTSSTTSNGKIEAIETGSECELLTVIDAGLSIWCIPNTLKSCDSQRAVSSKL